MQEHALELLRLLETPGVGPARVHSLRELAGGNAAEFLKVVRDRDQLRKVLSERQIEELVGNERDVAAEWQKLGSQNVRFISMLDDTYPAGLRSQLGRKAPPLLMALGNVGLLNATSVGFCGSRKASEKGLATAADCADQLARSGLNVVSGYAAGIDVASHRAALAAGGTTTLVLCEGILHFSIKKDLSAVWDWERVAVVTEFLPRTPWSARNAMQRNQTICALSKALILVEAAAIGGSVEAGRSALRMGIPLFAPLYEGLPESAAGNRQLLGQGGNAIRKSRNTGRANLKELLLLCGGRASARLSGGTSYGVEPSRPVLSSELRERQGPR
ncbi:MAG: DNA-processing protein DprA [Deltaproteobacteria bacterium]|nr:DNA-processing protein DprA [Deltaproteobacteria bacterium]